MKSDDIVRRVGNLESGLRSLNSTVALTIQEPKRNAPILLPPTISQFDRPCNQTNPFEHPVSDGDDSDQEHGSNSRPIHLGSILGTFECGESFLPETYTMYQLTPRLFCYDAFHVQTSDFQRVSHCSILYSPTPRKWLRLTAIVTISIESRYWSTWTVRLSDHRWARDLLCLPASMERQFESRLRSSDAIRQDSVLEAYSGGQPDLKLSKIKQSPNFDVRAHLWSITSKLYHQGFTAYHEKDLTHHLLSNGLFAAKIPGESQWWLEIRFRSVQSQFEKDLHWLDVITACTNSPRIAAFVSRLSLVGLEFLCLILLVCIVFQDDHDGVGSLIHN